jgi:Flp pilus assembly protein TadB
MAAAALVLSVPAASVAATSTTPTTSRTTIAPSSQAATPVTNKTTSASPKSSSVAAKPKPAAAKPKPALATPKKPVAKPKKKKRAKPLVPLSGWLGSGAKFPAESLILSVPRKVHLLPSQVQLSENGAPVTGFSLTPLAQAAPGDFGFVVAIDTSPSVPVAELNREMRAVRALASQRQAGQGLGLIGFGATPTVLLPLTSNIKGIPAGLQTTPPTVPGADTSAAEAGALQQLSAARDAAGAVVVISDGNGTRSPDSATRAALAAAAAAHIQVVTIGLRDGAATASSLAALRSNAPGPFFTVTGAGLARQLAASFSSATTGYIVRYRSRMRPGQAVAVSARVDGTKGTVTGGYTVPTPRVRHLPKPTHRAAARPGPRRSSVLSSSPSFLAAPAAPASAPAASSFWSSSGSVAVIAGIAALLVGFAVMLIVNRPSRRAVRTRVGSFTALTLATAAGETDDPDAQGFGGLVRLLERGGFWPKFVLDVDISHNPRTPVQLVKRAMIAGAIVALLLFLLTGTALYALLTLVATPLVLRATIARAARKQRARFRELLPMHLQDLSGAMRAGRSVVGALASVAAGADEPIKTELDRAVRDEQLGLPLEESLEAIARRMDADDMDQVALVAALNRRSGSNVAEALDRVAEGARERADLRREVKALTGQAKMSSWVLTGMPPLLLIGITVIAPVYAHPLLHTPIGLGLLVLSALMVFSGWKVMGKIINVKV